VTTRAKARKKRKVGPEVQQARATSEARAAADREAAAEEKAAVVGKLEVAAAAPAAAAAVAGIEVAAVAAAEHPHVAVRDDAAPVVGGKGDATSPEAEVKGAEATTAGAGIAANAAGVAAVAVTETAEGEVVAEVEGETQVCACHISKESAGGVVTALITTLPRRIADKCSKPSGGETVDLGPSANATTASSSTLETTAGTDPETQAAAIGAPDGGRDLRD